MKSVFEADKAAAARTINAIGHTLTWDEQSLSQCVVIRLYDDLYGATAGYVWMHFSDVPDVLVVHVAIEAPYRHRALTRGVIQKTIALASLMGATSIRAIFADELRAKLFHRFWSRHVPCRIEGRFVTHILEND